MKRMIGRGAGQTSEGTPDFFALFKLLGLAYIMTAVVLLIMAFVLYKVGMSERTVDTCMIVLYAGVNFLTGFLAGKRMKTMKFLWGLILGLAYFLVLMVLSLAAGRTGTMFTADFITTLLLCAGAGTLGGMVG